MRTGAVALTLAVLGGCGLAPAGHEVRYTGALPECGSSAATLTRQGSEFVFAPTDGSLVIHGIVAADGGFAGQLNTQPPGKPPFLLAVTGHLADESATLSYSTPRCRAEATLARVHMGLF
jgi:hypothetical protein